MNVEDVEAAAAGCLTAQLSTASPGSGAQFLRQPPVQRRAPSSVLHGIVASFAVAHAVRQTRRCSTLHAFGSSP